MRAQTVVLMVGALAALCAMAPTSWAEPIPVAPKEAAAELQVEAHARGKSQLSKLFDFANYKQLFGKHYKSLLEELNRRRLFFSRACRVFLASLKYKFRQRNHFESLNHMSDYSDSELAHMQNKRMAERLETDRKSMRATVIGGDDGEQNDEDQDENQDRDRDQDQDKTQSAASEQLPEFLPDLNEDVEAELRRLAEQHGNEPAFKELREAFAQQQQRARTRRSAGPEEALAPRELPQLINVASEGAGRAQSAKVVTSASLASNNPNYEHLEMASFGLQDQQEEVNWARLKNRVDKRQLSDQLFSSLSGLSEQYPNYASALLARDKHKPDAVFFDHRESGCLFEPRSQGTCGSCYAFASISVMEWLHCTQTGKLVAFSEQYMIDCGKGRYGDEGGDMLGCSGALDPAVAQFIHNFGMELRANYPYAMREQQCPYDEDYDLKKTGYIRMELGGAIFIGQAKWETYLPFQPLFMAMNAPADFHAYGGGVYEGAECAEVSNHAMVLVGHGRQDGLEYWLIRNSYSTGWGEQGYFKLAKAATKRCSYAFAVAFGTRNAVDYSIDIKKSEGKLPARAQAEDQGYISSLLNWVG